MVRRNLADCFRVGDPGVESGRQTTSACERSSNAVAAAKSHLRLPSVVPCLDV
jgi:hypothetical protein